MSKDISLHSLTIFKLEKLIKKIRYIYFLLFLISSRIYSQSVTLKEIKLNANPKFLNVKEKTIIYPIIIVQNKNVEKIINEEIRNEIIEPIEEKKSIVKYLEDFINNGLTDLYYDITFNKKGILSLNIYKQESGGAHLISSNTYFNFDITTGKDLNIYNLLEEDKIDSFKKVVFKNKITFLQAYKNELKRDKTTGKNNMDSISYNWIVDEINTNCISQVQIEDFSLSNLDMEIIDPCEFPSIIRAFEPDYHLKFSYKFLTEFMRPEYKKRFLK